MTPNNGNSMGANPFYRCAGPNCGVVKNSSEAPLRWSHGLIFERGQYLYVTSGIGTSTVPWRWRVPPEIVALEVTGTSTEPFGMGPR